LAGNLLKLEENADNKKADLRRLFYQACQLTSLPVQQRLQEQQQVRKQRRQQEQMRQPERQRVQQQVLQLSCHKRTKTGPTERQRSEQRVSLYFLELVTVTGV